MNKRNLIDQELAKSGWTKRFIAGEPRLSEAVLAYQEAGFEIRLEPFLKTDGEICEDDVNARECRVCFNGHEDAYKIIYTRPKEGQKTNPLMHESR